MPRAGFELTIPVFERAKSVHALDRAVTVIGSPMYTLVNKYNCVTVYIIYLTINVAPVFIKGRKFQIGDYSLLKNDTAPCTLLTDMKHLRCSCA
jgi:hypothetical protein